MSSFTEITEKAKESFREVHEVIDKSCNSDSIADKMFGIALAKNQIIYVNNLSKKVLKLVV